MIPGALTVRIVHDRLRGDYHGHVKERPRITARGETFPQVLRHIAALLEDALSHEGG